MQAGEANFVLFMGIGDMEKGDLVKLEETSGEVKAGNPARGWTNSTDSKKRNLGVR